MRGTIGRRSGCGGRTRRLSTDRSFGRRAGRPGPRRRTTAGVQRIRRMFSGRSRSRHRACIGNGRRAIEQVRRGPEPTGDDVLRLERRCSPRIATDGFREAAVPGTGLGSPFSSVCRLGRARPAIRLGRAVRRRGPGLRVAVEAAGRSSGRKGRAGRDSRGREAQGCRAGNWRIEVRPPREILLQPRRGYAMAQRKTTLLPAFR